jgi:hypothetical protein
MTMQACAKQRVGGIVVACLYLLLALSTSTHATIIVSFLSKDSLTLGERIELSVSLITPPGAKVEPPPADNGFGPMKVKEWRSDRAERKSSDSVSFSYQLTTYEVAQCTIPKLPYIVMHEGTQDTFYAEQRLVRVISLLAKAGKDTVLPRDIKAQQIAGKPSRLWLWLLLGAIIIATGIFLGRYLYLKYKQPPPPPPPPPPYDEAIEALKRLDARQYLLKGMVREYTFEISEIFKRYIGRRFEVNAADLTTEEMHRWIKISPLSESMRRLLDWFFSATDPVKFARLVPESDTVNRFGTDVRAFLEETRPRPETISTPPQPSQVPESKA